MSEQHHQLIRFVFIGVASTGLYFGLLITLRSAFSSVIVLTAICYAVAMVFNFLAQGLFTFQLQRLSRNQMGRYFVMQGTAMTLNSLAMAGLVDLLSIQIFLAQVVVTLILTIVTFLLSKRWVYL